eukprot:398359-Hanusia_phi.AAC.2
MRFRTREFLAHRSDSELFLLLGSCKPRSQTFRRAPSQAGEHHRYTAGTKYADRNQHMHRDVNVQF